jgi:DNA polymerase-3 subunit delta
MILKNFELNKINFNTHKYFLLYGENQAHIEDVLKKNFKNVLNIKELKYDENEILNNQINFFNEILNSSFFDREKLIIITRTTDKIKDIIEEILTKNITDTIIVLLSSKLEKKSKLRSFFEKNINSICIPFYADTDVTLIKYTQNYFREKKISISQNNINLIIRKSNSDRASLLNELEKISIFYDYNKALDEQTILKLITTSENNNISELIDNCLGKNKFKTINFLNDNSFNNEDCFILVRSFLSKCKRLLRIYEKIAKNNDLEKIFSELKPPIFWKDKEIVKKQLKNWNTNKIKKLIIELNQTEILIKKNPQISINLIRNLILENCY